MEHFAYRWFDYFLPETKKINGIANVGGGLEPIGTQEDDMEQPSGRLETLEDRRAEKPGGRVGKWEGEYPGGRLDPTRNLKSSTRHVKLQLEGI